jgi:hypothetical protein
MVAHRSLFDVLLATEDDVAAQWVDVVGPLLREWWEKWEAWPKYFTEAGAGGQPIEGRWMWSLDRRYEEWVQKPRSEQQSMGTMDAREREAFFVIMRRMLAFKPGDQPSAKEVLVTEWMRDWALPEYAKVMSLRG